MLLMKCGDVLSTNVCWKHPVIIRCVDTRVSVFECVYAFVVSIEFFISIWLHIRKSRIGFVFPYPSTHSGFCLMFIHVCM